jgi:hypothetical protein
MELVRLKMSDDKTIDSRFSEDSSNIVKGNAFPIDLFIILSKTEW